MQSMRRLRDWQERKWLEALCLSQSLGVTPCIEGGSEVTMVRLLTDPNDNEVVKCDAVFQPSKKDVQ